MTHTSSLRLSIDEWTLLSAFESATLIRKNTLALGVLYQRIAHTFVQWRTVRVYGVIIAIDEVQPAQRGRRSGSRNDSFTRIAKITHWRRHQSRDPIISQRERHAKSVSARSGDNGRPADWFADGIR